MDLQELRELVAENRWVDEQKMRWTLGIDDLRELVADIESSLARGLRGDVRSGYSAGYDAGRAESHLPTGLTAASESPLGVELSKIRDRLNAHETQVPPVHPSVRDRLDALETADAGVIGRLDTLSDGLHLVESKLHARIAALESALGVTRADMAKLGEECRHLRIWQQAVKA